MGNAPPTPTSGGTVPAGGNPSDPGLSASTLVANGTSTPNHDPAAPAKDDGKQLSDRTSDPLQPQGDTDESRYALLAATCLNGKVTREAFLSSFGLVFSPFVTRRFFEVALGPQVPEAPLDLLAYLRASHVLLHADREERRKFVFTMFDPLGAGRVRKTEFRKMAVELMRGFDLTAAQLAQLPPFGAEVPENKTLVQVYSDSVYSIFCKDEKRGLSFNEWIQFAVGDPEVCRLIGSLDQRRATRVFEVRERYHAE